MRRDSDGKSADAAGNFTAAKGAERFVSDTLKAEFRDSFPREAIDNINWYPPVPAGLEGLEGRILDRIRAAG